MGLHNPLPKCPDLSLTVVFCALPLPIQDLFLLCGDYMFINDKEIRLPNSVRHPSTVPSLHPIVVTIVMHE